MNFCLKSLIYCGNFPKYHRECTAMEAPMFQLSVAIENLQLHHLAYGNVDGNVVHLWKHW